MDALSQRTVNRSTRRIVVIAALLYIVIAVAAIVAHMIVPTTIQEAIDSVQATGARETGEYRGIAAAVVEHLQVWMVGGAGGEFIILLSEVVLSVLLFAIFASVDRTIAILAMVARLVMTTIHGANVIFYFAALRVARFVTTGARGTGGLSATGGATGLGDAAVEFFIELHGIGFTIGIAFLVIHMFALGYVMWRSSFIPRWIAGLFLLAGVGYLVDTTGLLFVGTYDTTPVPVTIAIASAEMVFPIWLLIVGWRRIGATPA